MDRKDKAIEDINSDFSSNNINKGNSEILLNYKGKETSLIMNLRKQIKEVDKEIRFKASEHEQLKKNLRITKLNELDVEIFTMNDELNKIRRFLEISAKSNLEKEKYLYDFVLLKDLSAKQQNQLVVLYEKKSELESDLKKKENDLEIQKILVKEKDTKIIKLTKEYKEQLELSEKLDKEAVQNDTSYLTNKLATLESKMVGLKKEIAFFKSESE
jgi:hypothetical protein